MKNIYLVSEGSYSDYSISAVFDSEELAERYIQLYCKGGAIETYKINPNKREMILGYSIYYLQMDKEGNTIKIENRDNYTEELPKYWYYVNNKEKINFMCFAKSKEHAVKIANEHRTRILANNEWGLNWHERKDAK